MAVDAACLYDLRAYVRKRVAYIKYIVGGSSYTARVRDAEIRPDGVVRVKASLVPGQAITINRVELYNNNGELWAHQDCTITIDNRQTGVMYWFDFTIKEGTT